MANIQSYLNQIKNAVFGKDVRESIHDAIKQCYDDAAVNHDNANMEVKLARGTHDTLNDRLVENEKNQENLSSQLDNKAKQCELIVERNRIDLLTKIENQETEGNTELLDLRIGANGKNYTVGGDYLRDISKGTGLLNNSIIFTKLSKELQDNFIIEKDEINLEYKTGGYWQYIKGTFITNNDALYNYVEEISVNPGGIYIISGSSAWESNLYVIKDNYGKVIEAFPNTKESKKDFSNILITIPNDGCKIFINSLSLNPTKFYKLTGVKINYNKLDNYKENSIDLHALDTKISDNFTESYSECNITWTTGGYYQNGNAKLVEYDTISYAKIEVKSGEKFKVTGTSYWLANIYIITDKYNNILSSFPNTNETTTVYYDKEFLIPNDGAYLLLNQKNDNVLTSLSKATSYKIKKEKELQGINWVAFGDSLTDSNTLKSEYNYVQYVANSLELNFTNCGEGGTGYLKGNGKEHQFYNRTNDIPSNTDILTVFGSFNDLYVDNYTIGNINDTDTSTLYGAIKKFIENCWTINPDMIIGIITPTPWEGWWRGHHDSNRVEKALAYINVLKDIAQYYSLPILDLYSCSNLRPWELYIKQKYYLNADGVHPNSLGHKKYIYPKVESFIKSMIK